MSDKQNESVLQFIVNLSVSLVELEHKVDEALDRLDALENFQEGVSEQIQSLEERADLAERNNDTMIKLLNHIMQEVQILKANPQPNITVHTWPGEPENAIDGEGKENNEVDEGAVRSEEG